MDQVGSKTALLKSASTLPTLNATAPVTPPRPVSAGESHVGTADRSRSGPKPVRAGSDRPTWESPTSARSGQVDGAQHAVDHVGDLPVALVDVEPDHARVPVAAIGVDQPDRAEAVP